MSRLTWFAAGAATGIYALLKARRAGRNLTPDGIAARAAALGVGFRTFTAEVSSGMAERESELRDQLALPATGEPTAVSQIEPSTRHEDLPDGHR